MPLNPRGRTGLSGRGLLGKFGPNHAADTVVTRWAVDAETGERCVSPSGGPVMEFVAITRKVQWLRHFLAPFLLARS